MTSKALSIRKQLGTPHYVVAWEGGGEIPADLQGAFTTPVDAKRAIAVWEAANRKEPVEVKDYVPEEPPRRGRPPAKPIGG